MYAFGPIPRQKKSGKVIGTHQKIDRVARKQLSKLLKGDDVFPSITDILHFEGSRGPDAIKFKSPGIDEPKHFIDPDNPKKGDLLIYIANHQTNLAQAIRSKDMVKAGYEAAWLAHAVTDGLTPAHHDSFDEQMEILRPAGHKNSHKVSSKLIMPHSGSNVDFIRNNWKYWGAGGVMSTHTLFEAGIASSIKPFKFENAAPNEEQLASVSKYGFEKFYVHLVRDVASLNMYETFKKTGWTSKLVQQSNSKLIPIIIVAVTLAWYDATMMSKENIDEI